MTRNEIAAAIDDLVARATPLPGATPSAPACRPRILVVDDMAEYRSLLSEVLTAEGYAVESAADGREALDKAVAAPPDLVLMDASMPNMTGFEACRRLKQNVHTRFVPVVIVTALDSRHDRLEGIAAGCDDFLTKPVDTEQLLARTRAALRLKTLVDQLEEAENVLVSLANALEAKDAYTRGHSDRVAALAAALGELSGLAEDECRNLHRAGMIHDIGKIGVRREYLAKAGRLTLDEREQVQLHPLIGYDICRPLRTLAPILPLVRGHHERLDGSGYPDRLGGAQVSLALRCLSVADVYDALTSARPYRPSLGHDKALAILDEEARAGYWDGGVVARVDQALKRAGSESA